MDSIPLPDTGILHSPGRKVNRSADPAEDIYKVLQIARSLAADVRHTGSVPLKEGQMGNGYLRASSRLATCAIAGSVAVAAGQATFRVVAPFPLFLPDGLTEGSPSG